ncbi:rhamnulokinase [Vagococcus silagei]|uniref:Rhamnulokinase n=1 Tax=Vagococcus silagei TaxID=2508885 RepID=A0A4S3B5J4_9ENTE|nr:rhamnulokinase family protein [Vagococcus silagei]THB60726.1 rhamnulokinase [Vagococcus silagei]
MKLNVLAFDFGASSGRAIVGKFNDYDLVTEEVHRFENRVLEEDGTLYWDIDYLLANIIEGIKKATAKYEIKSLGIDTWGVDFGMLNEQGELIQNPVHYRDKRTQGSVDYIYPRISIDELYQRTGNQIMEINTLFQLLTVKMKETKKFNQVAKILLMPDLLNYLLTGEMRAEQSIASTTQLMNPRNKEWDTDLMHVLGIPETLFPELVPEGHLLGTVKSALGVPPIQVINVCEHDTASAVLSVPSNQNFLFISCGTWSLVGTELTSPVMTEKAQEYNLTNESGNQRTTRFLKNCTGLWIIQELKREYELAGTTYNYEEISKMSELAEHFKCLIDTDDARFGKPGAMKQKIQDYATQTGQSIPETPGEFFRCVYESLAFKYKYTFFEITDAVGREFDTVNIVGGGSKSAILCQMVANASGMRVCAGPVEATALGNLIQQLITHGALVSVYEAREWIKKFANVRYFYPEERYDWDQHFSRYQQLLNQTKVEVS